MQPHSPRAETSDRVANAFGVRLPLAEAPLDAVDREALDAFFRECAFGVQPHYRFDEHGSLCEYASSSHAMAGIYPSPRELLRRVVSAFEGIGLKFESSSSADRRHETARQERRSTRASLAEIIAGGSAPEEETCSEAVRPDFIRLNEWLRDVSKDGSLVAALRKWHGERQAANKLHACSRVVIPPSGHARIMLDGKPINVSFTASQERGAQRLEFQTPDGISVAPMGFQIESDAEGVALSPMPGHTLHASKRGVHGCIADFGSKDEETTKSEKS